nr:hypothetical protein [Candidatus Sigynarchaeum springense]
MVFGSRVFCLDWGGVVVEMGCSNCCRSKKEQRNCELKRPKHASKKASKSATIAPPLDAAHAEKRAQRAQREQQRREEQKKKRDDECRWKKYKRLKDKLVQEGKNEDDADRVATMVVYDYDPHDIDDNPSRETIFNRRA